MSATAIDALISWEALDSRGRPTVACSVTLADGSRGVGIAPAGASTGTHEARELRDGEERYSGQGVLQAVGNVTGEIADAVRGLDVADQAALDGALRAVDGTEDLGRLGANAVLAVSIAGATAAAASARLPLYAWMADADATPLLPLPMVNIISGGAHAGRSIDVQDFLVVPVGAEDFPEAITWAARVRRGTAEVLAGSGESVALVADEGGLGPVLATNRQALELVTHGIERAGLRPGQDVSIAIDIAATQLLQDDGSYRFAVEERRFTSAELVEELVSWCTEFPICSLEDALAEDDWAGWSLATQKLTGRQLLGDDLFVTNRDRLARGVERLVANAILVKPNQIGTLTAARDVVTQAIEAGYATVLSARSGDTEQDWLADLAVGWRTGQIKVGSTMRSERTSKWNRLLQVHAELGARADYAGPGVLGR